MGGPVILFKGDDPSRRLKLARKIENVADGCRPERIDRLGIVADDRQPAAIRLQLQQNVGLQPVRILVFIDQDMIEPVPNLGS